MSQIQLQVAGPPAAGSSSAFNLWQRFDQPGGPSLVGAVQTPSWIKLMTAASSPSRVEYRNASSRCIALSKPTAVGRGFQVHTRTQCLCHFCPPDGIMTPPLGHCVPKGTWHAYIRAFMHFPKHTPHLYHGIHLDMNTTASELR